MNSNDNSDNTNNNNNNSIVRVLESPREWSPHPAFSCINWLALMQNVWKGKGNQTQLGQSEHELLITDFGCLADWHGYIFANYCIVLTPSLPLLLALRYKAHQQCCRAGKQIWRREILGNKVVLGSSSGPYVNFWDLGDY